MEIPITLNKNEIEIILDSLDNEISMINSYDDLDNEEKGYRDMLIALANKINKDYQNVFLIRREKPDQSLTNPDFLEIH
jgi:hypothetical protein